MNEEIPKRIGDRRDPELEKKNHWYRGSDIKKIIKADKIAKGYSVDISSDATYYGDVTLSPTAPPDISLNRVEPLEKTVWINIAPSMSVEVSPSKLQEGIANTVEYLLKQEGAPQPPRTFIFQANVGGNHWATYACRVDENRQGEILIINSAGGYRGWDEAAKAGFQQAFNNNNIQAQVPIEMTPQQNVGFAQKGGSACGPITVAMSCAIDGTRSFAEQKIDLEKEMKNICKGDHPDDKSYEILREKHRKLESFIRSAEKNADKKPTDDQKNAIIAEVAKPNYPPAALSDDATLDSRKDNSKNDSKKDTLKDDLDPSSSQKTPPQDSKIQQQNGKKNLPPAVVEECLRNMGCIGDNGQYVKGDEGKRIHFAVSNDGGLSAHTDSPEMLEEMIRLFSEKMDKFKENPRELILSGDPQAVQAMTAACKKYNITVVDPNQQQHKKSDDANDPKRHSEEKSEKNPKITPSKLKIPAAKEESQQNNRLGLN